MVKKAKLLAWMVVGVLSCIPSAYIAQQIQQASSRSMEENTQDWLLTGRITPLSLLPWQGAHSLEASPGGDALSMFGPAPALQWPNLKVVGQPDGSLVLEGVHERTLVSRQGEFLHRTLLRSFGMDEWAWSPEGYWIGLKKGEKPSIQAVDPAGNAIWKLDYLPYKVGQIVVVEGKCLGIFIQDGSTYQTEIGRQGCGAAKRVGEGDILPVFVPTLQDFYVLGWDAESGHKYWRNLPSEASAKHQVIPASMGQCFTFAAGADRKGNAFGYFGSQLGKVDWANGNSFLMDWEGLCVDEAHVFASRMGKDRGGLDLLELLPDGTYRDRWIALPEEWSSDWRSRIWRICKISEGIYTFLSRSGTNYAWECVEYDSRSGGWGQVSQVSDLASQYQLLGPAQNWAILPDGGIVLPLATPKGLQLLRFD